MNTFNKKVTFFPVLLFCTAVLNSQSLTNRDFIKAVKNADFYYSIEDYYRAADLFNNLNKEFPENSNLASKLGICYLHIDGKKDEALLLLKKAALNVVQSTKEYNEYGAKAPSDVWLYLAHAYQINDSLTKSISIFNEAKKRLEKNDTYLNEYIDKQIRECKYAMEMRKKPLTIVSDLFAPWLKEFAGACNPVVSKNDSVFIFTLKQNEKTSIYCSYKQGVWKPPVNITSQLGGYDRFYSNSITGDGKLLILFMDDGDDGNLYFSQRKDTTWSKIKSVGKNINTIYWESHGYITPDGKTIFIASNRPGGKGNLDIWVSEKDADGSWKRPENCGGVINTADNENTPFFDPATGTLLFSSMGHLSMGGYDVFRSTYKNGTWTNPIGIPYAFNNTLENTFFILNNTTPGFITSLYDDNTKSRNIYNIVAKDPAEKITTARGSVLLLDGMNINPEKVKIELINKDTPLLINTIPISDSGSFTFEIRSGDYQLFVSHVGYKTDTINLNLPLFFSGNYLAVMVSLIPEKVFSGDFLSATNLLFEFNSYELSEKGILNLEMLIPILQENQELRIDVSGYSDAVGSTEYNRLLSDKRAQAVIDYLVSAGISQNRFSKKAMGNSDFVEVNFKNDGSDNPDGRKSNRRAVIGIVNPKSGLTINKEISSPEHLRQAYSMKYNIILLKTTKKLPQDYFNNLLNESKLFVNPVKIDSVFWYILGVFYNKPEALDYLSLAKNNGFKDASLINQYDLKNELKSAGTPDAGGMKAVIQKVFTIQLKSSEQPLDLTQFFKEIDGVKEIHGNDGMYNYTYGNYDSMSEARAALIPLQESGYKDAVIVEVNMVVFK